MLKHSVIFCLLVFGLKARAQAVLPTDTMADRAKATRIINQKFDDAYLQTARLSTFGNEYGHPVPTSLVADLAGNFVLFDTPNSRFEFIFNPRVMLRLLNTRGAPVKAPSYMPGGTLYFRLNRDYDRPSFLALAYSHHSNGIRGPSLNPDGSFNTDSGKFTTNFYTLTYTRGKHTDMGSLAADRYESLGLELHSGLFGTGYSEGLKDNYGFVRVNGSWMYNLQRQHSNAIDPQKTMMSNWMRLQIDFMYILDTYNNYGVSDYQKRLNIDAYYYYQLPFMQNVALMLGGGYRGQDIYNSGFQDSYAFLSVGVAAGVSFASPRPSPKERE